MAFDEDYEAADVLETSSKETLLFALNLMLAWFKSLVISVPVLLMWIVHLIIPPKPKCIAGQLALITGGSVGIGKALGMRLASEGCNIAIANRNHQEGEKTAAEIRKKFGVAAKAFKVDVSKPEEVAKLKNDVESSLGDVDILVNNAGLLAVGTSLMEGADAEIQAIVDTNLTSYFWTSRQFLPGMIERRRGHVVAVSSILAKLTMPNSVAYASTKCGNDGFMSALYDDLCFLGHDEYIKLTTVYPTVTATQKKFTDILSILQAFKIPAYDPSLVADIIVKGVLLNRREFVVPPSTALCLIFKMLPDKALKAAKASFINWSKVDEFTEMWRKMH